MKTILLLLTLFVAKTAGASVAPLWIPGEHSNLEGVLTLLENSKELKLTTAFSEIPPQFTERIKALAAKNRIETAARIPGDPLLPLFYYSGLDTVRWNEKPAVARTNEPFFMAQRMSTAKEDFTARFKKTPEGFVNAPGGFAPDLAPLAKSMGFKWLATGPLISTAAFNTLQETNGVYLIPFSTAPAATDTTLPQFLVFDETVSTDSADTGALLAFLASAGTGIITVSEAIKLSISSAVPALSAAIMVAPWSGDYSAWASLPLQAGALDAFAETRAELMAHLNLKQGDEKAAKPAFSEYYSVESGPKLLKLASPDPDLARETEIELQNSLTNVYRLMEKAPPGWLFSSLTEVNKTQKNTGQVKVSKQPGGLVLQNSDRQPVLPIENGRQKFISKKTAKDPYATWKLASFSLSWTEAELKFLFTASSGPVTAEEFAASPARFDLYIDINNRPRAGSARPLEGRSGRLFPDSAWEYALDISATQALLYTATARGPQKVFGCKTSWEPGSFVVKIPRTVLKGNPALWGYIVFMTYSADGKQFALTDFLADDFTNGYYYAVRPGEH